MVQQTLKSFLKADVCNAALHQSSAIASGNLETGRVLGKGGSAFTSHSAELCSLQEVLKPSDVQIIFNKTFQLVTTHFIMLKVAINPHLIFSTFWTALHLLRFK